MSPTTTTSTVTLEIPTGSPFDDDVPAGRPITSRVSNAISLAVKLIFLIVFVLPLLLLLLFISCIFCFLLFPPKTREQMEAMLDIELVVDNEAFDPQEGPSGTATIAATRLLDSLTKSTCDICIMDYEIGDVVASSRNTDCGHIFHKDCILEWLQKKQTCPCCRRNYLVGTNRKSGNDLILLHDENGTGASVNTNVTETHNAPVLPTIDQGLRNENDEMVEMEGIMPPLQEPLEMEEIMLPLQAPVEKIESAIFLPPTLLTLGENRVKLVASSYCEGDVLAPDIVDATGEQQSEEIIVASIDVDTSASCHEQEGCISCTK